MSPTDSAAEPVGFLELLVEVLVDPPPKQVLGVFGWLGASTMYMHVSNNV